MFNECLDKKLIWLHFFFIKCREEETYDATKEGEDKFAFGVSKHLLALPTGCCASICPSDVVGALVYVYRELINDNKLTYFL